jgi:hypothetical protein
MMIDVSHVPTARAFDFRKFILAQGAAPYRSKVSCILGKSPGDCRIIVMSSAYASIAGWLPLLPITMGCRISVRVRIKGSIHIANSNMLRGLL